LVWESLVQRLRAVVDERRDTWVFFEGANSLSEAFVGALADLKRERPEAEIVVVLMSQIGCN